MLFQFILIKTDNLLIFYFLSQTLVFMTSFTYSFAYRLVESPINPYTRHFYTFYSNKKYFDNSKYLIKSQGDIDDIKDDFFSIINTENGFNGPFIGNLINKKVKKKSHKKIIIDHLSTKRIQDLAPPRNESDPGYNCLIHLIGIPYNFSEFMIVKWLEDYQIELNDVTFLLEFNGSFTGDAFVRCKNREIQKKIIKDKHMNHISDRYIEIYPVAESAYKQYYQAKYFKKMKRGHYTPLETLVPLSAEYKCKKRAIEDIQCGDLIIGKIISITDKGAILNPINIDVGDKNIIFILVNNRLSQNITLSGDIVGDVELKLILGMDINFYFEKLRVIDKNTDFWNEKLVVETINDEINNPLTIVYGTMDCTVNKKKVKLAEQKFIV